MTVTWWRKFGFRRQCVAKVAREAKTRDEVAVLGGCSEQVSRNARPAGGFPRDFAAGRQRARDLGDDAGAKEEVEPYVSLLSNPED